MLLQKSVKDIGLSKQLFIDDYLIDEMHQVRPVLHPARKYRANPLLTLQAPPGTGPLPERGIGAATVLYDEAQHRFRMWYTGGTADGMAAVYYATSADGIAWEAPQAVTGLPSPVYGIVFTPEMTGSEFPEKHYKALTFNPKFDGWAVFYSPDGLVWTPQSNKPVLTGDPAGITDFLMDSSNVVLAGTDLGKICVPNKSAGYLPDGVYHREAPPPKFLSFPQLLVSGISGTAGARRRCIGISTCPMTFPETFTNWSNPVMILAPDALDDELAADRLTSERLGAVSFAANGQARTEFAGMAGFHYESLFLGLLWVWQTHGQDEGTDPSAMMDIQLVASRDLIHWQRIGERQAVLPLGSSAQDWDSQQIYTTNAPLIVGDEVWIYYTGQGESPFSLPGVGLAKLRLDDFVSIDAQRRPGYLTTRPIRFGLESGYGQNHLVINGRAPEGKIAVEILDGAGAPLPGFGREDCDVFSGDNLRHTVTWRGHPDLSALHGTAIRLRFHLEQASLRSFVFI